MSKPSLASGTRDFSPIEVQKRKYVTQIIESVFKKYAYQPIETPAMENLATLMGKYGAEGDKLIFKILNSGDYLSKLNEGEVNSLDSNALAFRITEKALRYDLTVPFARYVVMHRNDLQLPFKRYQIQPVWRADRPQKGRFREFYQCDADVVGSYSLWQEVELAHIYHEVFTRLGLSYIIRINNRKILSGLAEVLGIESQLTNFTVILDKLDKIGREKVEQEWESLGLTKDQIQSLAFLFDAEADNLEALNILLHQSEIGRKGIEELQWVINQSKALKPECMISFDPSLARGLNYYTGSIFEVVCPGLSLGSIGGGGRYDDLTGIFGMPNMPGVGISFGLDRIVIALEELNQFPNDIEQAQKILIFALDAESQTDAYRLASMLRDFGTACDVLPDPVKMKKGLDIANKRRVEFSIFIGESERSKGEACIKNMTDGNQLVLKLQEIVEHFLPE